MQYEIFEKEIGILDLFGKDTLENLQKTISKVLGLGVITSDYTGKPLTEMTGFTPFCKFMRNNRHQGGLCTLSDAFGIAQSAVTKKYSIYCCPCGLLEVAIPLVVDGRYLGGFLAGQVRCEDIPGHIQQFKTLIADGDAKDKNSVISQYYNNIPVYEFKKFEDMAELIYTMVNLLGQKEMSRRKNLKKTKILEMINDISNMAVVEQADETQEMTVRLADYLREIMN